MIRAVSISVLVLLAQCEDGEATKPVSKGLPSGLTHDLQDVRYEPVGAPIGSVRVVRLRYVQPALAGNDGPGFDAIEADFQVLCDTDGLAQRRKSAPNAAEIVVSVSSALVEFGETAPDVIQYIDAFTVENGRCVWGGL